MFEIKINIAMKNMLTYDLHTIFKGSTFVLDFVIEY
jgi:hypothetical protein